MIRLALCFWLVATAASAADVDPSLCRDVDDATRPLVPAELRPFYKLDHAVQACPAYDKEHLFLWWIMTINVDFIAWESWKDPALFPLYPDGISRRSTPKPYIVDSKGRELGRISDAFPTAGPPSRIDLSFSQWADDFPHRITIKVFDARVRGNYTAPPLQWNEKTHAYDQIGEGLDDVQPPHWNMHSVSTPPKTANGFINAFQQPDRGWKRVTAEEAVQLSASGHIVVAGLAVPGGSGHVAVVGTKMIPATLVKGNPLSPQVFAGSSSSWTGARSQGEHSVADGWTAHDVPYVSYWVKQ